MRMLLKKENRGLHKRLDKPFFHGGMAIHGFKRYAYGYPQSAGCVELPVKTAKEIFPYLYVGTVVTIVN